MAPLRVLLHAVATSGNGSPVRALPGQKKKKRSPGSTLRKAPRCRIENRFFGVFFSWRHPGSRSTRVAGRDHHQTGSSLAISLQPLMASSSGPRLSGTLSEIEQQAIKGTDGVIFSGAKRYFSAGMCASFSDSSPFFRGDRGGGVHACFMRQRVLLLVYWLFWLRVFQSVRNFGGPW